MHTSSNRRIAASLLLIVLFLAPAILSPPAKASSVIQNGQFTQKTAGWNTSSWVAGGADWRVEENVLTIESRDMNDARLNQEVTLMPDTVYRVSCEVKVDNISREGEAGVWVGFDYSPAKILARLDSTDWQPLRFYARSGKSQESAIFCLALGDYGSLASGQVSFRNIDILPETAASGTTIFSMEPYPTDGTIEDGPYPLGYWSQVLNKLLMAGLCFVFVYGLWRWGQRSSWLLPQRFEIALASLVLALAAVIRFLIIMISKGYPTDTGTFAAWAERMVSVGPGQFYNDAFFCDYPPGILYMLWFSGKLCESLGLVVLTQGLGLGVLFLPIVLCDIGLCILIWRYARQKLGVIPTFALLMIMAFHPVILYDTAVWHQVDAVLALALAATFMLLEKDKKLWAAAVYGLAVLTKPQALMLGPVFALPFLRALFDRKTRQKGILELLAGILISFGIILLLSLPFTGEQAFWPFSNSTGNWLVSKYFSTATSYPYATVNAHNIFTLFNGNFLPQSTPLGPLSYAQWAAVGLFAVLIACAVFYVYSVRNKTEWQTLSLLAAFVLAGLFTFGPRMHERYSFPLIALLPMAYAQLKDKGILNVFAMYGVGIYANMSLALMGLNEMDAYYQTAYGFASKFTAAYNILCFAYLAMICYDICVRNHLYMAAKQRLGTSLYNGFSQRPIETRFFASLSTKLKSFATPSGASPERHDSDAPPESTESLPQEVSVEGDAKKRDSFFSGVYHAFFRRSVPRGARAVRLLERRLHCSDHKLHWNHWDSVFLAILTLLYAVVAFVRLGTTNVPESYWRGKAGQEIRIAFDEPIMIQEIWTYGGISDGKLEILQPGTAASDVQEEGGAQDEDYISAHESDGLSIIAQQMTDPDVMYRWNLNKTSFVAEELLLRSSGDTWLEELVFVGEDGAIHTPNILSVSGEAYAVPDSDVNHLFDEQNTKPNRPDVLNGMYFDELYHGRTAYEHLNHLDPYENTHPPLGKVFIMIGIALFGMNPFGWRVVGTLFGVMMVPLFYLLARRLLKSQKLSAFVTILFTFDFMHFVQTRIATIDVYGVFFILLMYYFMLEYWQMNFYTVDVVRTLRPLALSGLFFGLGAASKWICLYAGAGLAVIFFCSLGMRLSEYIQARSAKTRGLAGADALVEKTKDFGENLLWTLGLCIIMFIVVPVIIYVASYIPYLLTTEKTYTLHSIGEIQRDMFSYHDGLTARHPYESSWWTWPLDIRPIFYYQGSHLPEGMGSAISSFGNPVVWWTGLICLVALIVHSVRKSRFDQTTLFILFGFAAQFLPWSFITRATFIYHYFASVPFILLATGYVFKLWIRRWPPAQYIAYGLTIACLLMFILYYPALSGLPVPRGYLDALRLLPSWTW